jgi:hypothetical protein
LKQRQLPSIVYVIGIVLGMIAFVVLINVGFFSLTQVEGLASILMLIIGVVGIRWLSGRKPHKSNPPVANNIAVALGIVTFAGAGFAFDQPGNVLYNLPLQWLFCPANTQLVRESDIRNPRAGTTIITQDFACVNSDGDVQAQVPIEGAMITRFVEYIVIGYMLLWLNGLYMRWRARG